MASFEVLCVSDASAVRWVPIGGAASVRDAAGPRWRPVEGGRGGDGAEATLVGRGRVKG